MKNHQGSSLIEVIFTLLLVTGTSFALLEQQVQLRQLLHQSLNLASQLNSEINNFEQESFLFLNEKSTNKNPDL